MLNTVHPCGEWKAGYCKKKGGHEKLPQTERGINLSDSQNPPAKLTPLWGLENCLCKKKKSSSSQMVRIENIKVYPSSKDESENNLFLLCCVQGHHIVLELGGFITAYNHL